MNYGQRFDVFAQSIDYNNAIDIALCGKDGNGDRTLVAPVDLDRKNYLRIGDDMITQPTMRMSPFEARALMDALWSAGVRPTVEDRDPQQVIEAMRFHLDDMRRLVFKEKGNAK